MSTGHLHPAIAETNQSFSISKYPFWVTSLGTAGLYSASLGGRNDPVLALVRPLVRFGREHQHKVRLILTGIHIEPWQFLAVTNFVCSPKYDGLRRTLCSATGRYNGAMPEEKERSLSFEASLEELERIVKELEKGDLPLEQSLALFESGMQLSSECKRQLEEAETRVEILMRKGSDIVPVPFNPDAPAK